MELALANSIATPSAATTVAAVREAASSLRGWAGERVVLASDDPLEQLTVVVAAATIGFEAAIVPAAWLTSQWLERVRADSHRVCSGLRADQVRPGSGTKPRSAGLVLHTSGSTRAPAPVVHPFERLDTFGRVADPGPQRWLVTYRPGSYAWTQVVMLGLLVPGQDLAFARSNAPSDLAAALADGVTAVSSTPSLWRYLLTCTPREQLAQLALRQLTLGGEPVDQPLLDRLRAIFPAARITHIYASTECGAMLACSDGHAGFPASCLTRPATAGAAQVRLEGGTLRVRSPFAAEAGGWVDTHDAAHVAGGRLHVLGRAEHDAINVAGQVVALGVLERFLHEQPAVAWARAYPVASAIVGSVVGVDLVLDGDCGLSRPEAERSIRAACREQLGEHYEPRVVRFVSQLPLAPSLKAARA